MLNPYSFVLFVFCLLFLFVVLFVCRSSVYWFTVPPVKVSSVRVGWGFRTVYFLHLRFFHLAVIPLDTCSLVVGWSCDWLCGRLFFRSFFPFWSRLRFPVAYVLFCSIRDICFVFFFV